MSLLEFPLHRARPSHDLHDGCFVRYVGPRTGYDDLHHVIGRVELFRDTDDDAYCASVEIRGRHYGEHAGLVTTIAQQWRPIAGADKVWRCTKCDRHFAGLIDEASRAPDCEGTEAERHPPHRTKKIAWKGMYR